MTSETQAFDPEDVPEHESGHFQNKLKYTFINMLNWGRKCFQEGQKVAVARADTPDKTLVALAEVFDVYSDGVMEFIEINDSEIVELFETSSAEIGINGQNYLFELKVSKV